MYYFDLLEIMEKSNKEVTVSELVSALEEEQGRVNRQNVNRALKQLREKELVGFRRDLKVAYNVIYYFKK